MLNRYFLFLITFIYSLNVLANDTAKAKRIKFLPVPAFGYSPETRTYIGAVTLFTIQLYADTATRISNAKIELNYTWNKQIIVESNWNYFFKEEKWFTRGLLHYSQYPDLYYGVGPHTPESNKLVYNSNRFVLDMQALRKISPGIFIGPGIRYISYTRVATNSAHIKYAELSDATTLGAGLVLINDTRNNLLTPLKGHYLGLSATYNFSQSQYSKINLDTRYYHTWKRKYTLATRFINDLNFGSPPFYDYAFLGGDRFVRGYYYGRYRDNHLSSLQAEFRLPVIWRFSMTLFAGISNLYSDEHPFSIHHTKPNYGTGLRFLIDRKDNTNLRIDYAAGANGNNGFYISFGESF